MTERPPEYVELHANSAFSFLEGASDPESLVRAAFQQDLPAMALLDRNGVYGSARFHTSAKTNGIKAHVGAEVTVAELGPRLEPPASLPARRLSEPVRLPLLCKSRTGYQNLCQMITRYKMRERGKCEGSAHIADLQEFSDGLICLTGGDEGPLAAALQRGGVDEARNCLRQLTELFGPQNVYVELQRHGDRAEEVRNQAALRLAESLQLPVLATNGVRYATQHEREVLDVFTAIRHHVSLDEAGRLLQTNSQRQVRNAKAMRHLFRDLPEAIDNTLLVSQRLEFALHDLGYEFPQYATETGEPSESFLRKRVFEGIGNRYRPKGDPALLQKALRQAERELALIEKLGFGGYFLIVWDVVRYCKANGILIQGRGSAANSVVCYALEITAVDPVGGDLLFERFLNEERRNEWPDVDLDLPSGDKREQAIQYVYQRYGELGAAMTANVISYQGKSAAREVGKALGHKPETIDRLSGLIGHWEWRKKDETLEDSFRQAGFDIHHRAIAKYVELCDRIHGLPRHLGQHSGGMVICQGQLNRVVPLERASMVGRTVVQWDKEDCNDLGLVKIDLLGLGMMAVLKDCLQLIPEHYGKEVDLANLPEDEDDVWDTLCAADTVGMFQVESRAQMASIPRNAPRRMYDLVVQVAIIRPGPIVGKMMHPYMRRRQKREAVTYPCDELIPVLERTLGVPLFQEQLLRMAMVVGEFSGAEAEELRKAVGMRRSWQRLGELMEKLRTGMTRKGLPPETQEAIVGSIQGFALYGFPESHAASFALIAYASAYFKVRYLAAFTCAMLNNQPMGFYTPAVIVKDAQRHGLRIKPVDVQLSDVRCTLEHEPDGSLSLRLGLNYVRGLKATTAARVVSERETAGPYRNVEDLSNRAPALCRSDLMQLARIGALNHLGDVEHRRDGVWKAERASRAVGPLFQSSVAAMDGQQSTSPLRRMEVGERLVSDYGGTGLTTGPHPMAYRRAELRRQHVLSAQELKGCPNGVNVTTAGAVIARQRPGTALGFIFLSMEDETGISNVIIHPQLYDRDRIVVSRAKFLQVSGKLQNTDGVIHVKAEILKPLESDAIAVRSHDFH